MTEKKSNHQANIVRITELLKHNNADNLEIVKINDYQVVVRKGEFTVGSLAVYVQPDSVIPPTLPFEFIWKDYVGIDGTVPEKRRRITVKKFRGEWSEGLLLPVSDFPELKIIDQYGRINQYLPSEGEDVSDRLGVTHYDPDKGTESTAGPSVSGPRRKYPKTLKGWWFWFLHKLRFKGAGKSLALEVSFNLPVYDVDAFKNHPNVFKDGENVFVTEKIHGSNARFICIDGIMYTGSRNQWKSPKANTIWNKALECNPWIEHWCRGHEGFALYGEVTPTQKGFDYGAKDGEIKFFLFDIRTPDGQWIERTWGVPIFPGALYGELAADFSDFYEYFEGKHHVPTLYAGPFDREKIKAFVDGPSLVKGANHIREGIVIKSAKERHVPGVGRAQLKLVSSEFLAKDSKCEK